MHSSISSSDSTVGPPTLRSGPRQATLAIIGLMVLVLIGAEMLSRFAFPRISQIEGRIRSDEHEAMAIRGSDPGSPPTLLLVGNSLLLRGLDYPKIRSEMAPDARVLRFVIENTEYLDWYYGLRHMFESGVRPSTVVLCLNLGQTVSSRTLGDYSARHLFGPSEILPLAHDAGLDATQTSSLFFAHWSAFYSSRATIRNFILNKSAPEYAAALHTLADNAGKPLPPDEELLSKAQTRLIAIQELCHRYGIELVLLVPPTLVRYNDLLAQAAGREHVAFDDPLPMGALTPDFFRPDGSHLNEKGAAVFTDAVARCLRKRLRKTDNASAAQAN